MTPLASLPQSSDLPSWRREIVGGLNATAVMLPMAVMFAFLAFGSVGAKAAQLGLTSSVVGLVLGGLVIAFTGRAPLPIASPSAPTSLIAGALVAQLALDPALDPATAEGAAALVAMLGATVALSGVLLASLAALRLGTLARFVPQPVLAGFMSGIALLIFVAQVDAVLGVPLKTVAREGLRAAFAQAHWLAVPVALGTTFAVLALARRFPRAPSALIGLLGALAAVEAVSASSTAPLALQRIGALSMSLPLPDVLRPLFGASGEALLRAHGGTMLSTAVVLALIGALQSVLNLASMDQDLNVRTDPNHELRAIGLANMASGVFGGLPLVYLRTYSIGLYSAGGRSYRSLLVSSVLLALVFSAGLPLVERLPEAVVAGVLIVVGWMLIDRWTRDLFRRLAAGDRTRELLTSLLIVVVVCAVTLVWGFVAGVGAGSLVALAVFVRAMNRSLVRRRYLAIDIPSRRVYPPALDETLAAARRRIEVIELEGALFFGNADRLADEADLTPAEIACLVVDFRRVTTIDASGAMALALLDQRLQRRRKTLMLAAVTRDNRHGRALAAHGMFRSEADWRGYPDADHAMEASEMQLLAAAGRPLEHLAIPLEQCPVFAGLTDAQRARLWPRLILHRVAAGDAVFEEGDPGNAIFVLTEGSITITDRARVQRFLAFSAGMCFGEAAVLDGRGRSAAAVADTASVLYELPASTLSELNAADPALAAQLYRNLAQHLSERLRSAGTAWRQAAG